MFYIPKKMVHYPELKPRLIRNFIIYAIFMSIGLGFAYPEYLLRFIGGVILGFMYLLSLFHSAEIPQRKMATGFSIFRMLIVSFLIVFIGQFKLLETCVVFYGFLSYKIVLVLEFIRYSIGIRLNRGK